MANIVWFAQYISRVHAHIYDICTSGGGAAPLVLELVLVSVVDVGGSVKGVDFTLPPSNSGDPRGDLAGRPSDLRNLGAWSSWGSVCSNNEWRDSRTRPQFSSSNLDPDSDISNFQH
eukprot:1384962-Amorphochlora_amoeboformis.AAC.1